MGLQEKEMTVESVQQTNMTSRMMGPATCSWKINIKLFLFDGFCVYCIYVAYLQYGGIDPVYIA